MQPLNSSSSDFFLASDINTLPVIGRGECSVDETLIML